MVSCCGQAVSASISYYFMNKIGKDHIQKCENVIKMSCRCYNSFAICKFTETGFKRMNLKHGFGKVKV